MVRREVEHDILPYVAKNKIGVIAYSPMGSGMLTGSMTRERIANLPEDDWRTRSVHFQEPLLTRNLRIAEKVTDIAQRLNHNPAVVAIAWVLRKPEVTGAIVGIRSADQVAGIIDAMDYRLDADTTVELDQFLHSLDQA